MFLAALYGYNLNPNDINGLDCYIFAPSLSLRAPIFCSLFFPLVPPEEPKQLGDILCAESGAEKRKI